MPTLKTPSSLVQGLWDLCSYRKIHTTFTEGGEEGGGGGGSGAQRQKKYKAKYRAKLLEFSDRQGGLKPLLHIETFS